MQKLFLKGLGITLLLNLLVKPATIFMVDINMQNELGAHQYGIFQTVLNVTFLFSMLLDMGMTNFMTRLIAQYPHMIHKYSDRLFSFRLLLVVVYISWSVVLFLVLHLPFQWWWILGLLLMHQISTITVNYVRAYTGGLLKFGLDAVLSVIERSVYFVLGCLLLYGNFIHPISMAWFVGIFVSSSTLSLLAALFIYVKLVAFPKFTWKPIFFIAIFRQSYPYAILVILMMLCVRLDAVFLEILHPNGTKQVAYYIQSFRLLDACWMFGVLFGSILLPVFSRVLKEKGSTTVIMTSALNLLVSGGLIMIAFTIGLKEIIFDALYKDANVYSYNSWIFLSMTFIPMCFTIVFGTLLTANKSMRKLNQIAALGLLTMVVLNVILIPFLGAIGTAIAAFSSQLTIGVLQYLQVRYKMKHHLAPYTWLKLGGLALVLGMILWVQLIVHFDPLVYMLILGGVWMTVILGLKIIDIPLFLKMFSKKEGVTDAID
jgi:O-antigen/teichoic acid export membrane protein